MLVFFFAPAGFGKIPRNSQNIRTYYMLNHRIRCIHSRSSLVTRFQTKMGKVWTGFQTKTVQKPYTLGRPILIWRIYLFILFYFISFAYYTIRKQIKNNKNNKCLIRQGCHNRGKPIVVVPELKKYVKNSKATYDN